jgi:alkylation response protein AidB-like acyl-CoA dehydrogenase
MLYFDNIEIPKESLIGEEGQGFKYLLQGLNPERVLFAARPSAWLLQRLSARRRYAKERVVFGRPIGQNQGVAHPLAKCWAELSAAELLAYKAARLYDRASSAARKRTPRSISAPSMASTPARPACWRMAAWAMRKSTTSSATCAKR